MFRNLHFLGTVFAEHEANPPLLVDANAVLSLTVARKRLQPIARRCAQVLLAHGRIELLQLGKYAFSNGRRMGPYRMPGKRRGTLLVLESFDRHDR